MLKLISTAAALSVAGLVAASAAPLSSVPSGSTTVTNWYKQSVYDPKDAKIGTIDDVLVDKSGKVTALVIGVGGFLGVGEKDVAVSPESVKPTTKNNNKWYLVMNATKDELKSAKGMKYDKDSTTWMADKNDKAEK
jgi:sporulation protein YlmC with PRC-barrel domain